MLCLVTVLVTAAQYKIFTPPIFAAAQAGGTTPCSDTARGRHCTLHLNIVLSRKAIVAAFRLVTILRESPYYCFLSVEGIVIFMIFAKVAPESEYAVSTGNWNACLHDFFCY